MFIPIPDYMGVWQHFINAAEALRHRFTQPFRQKKKHIELDFAHSDVPIPFESMRIQAGYIRSIWDPYRSRNSCSETIIPQKLPPRRDPVENLRRGNAFLVTAIIHGISISLGLRRQFRLTRARRKCRKLVSNNYHEVENRVLLYILFF